MSNLIAITTPCSRLEGFLKSDQEPILTSRVSYFRRPNFTWDSQGSMGIVPRRFVLDNHSQINEYNRFLISTPIHETRIYKGLSLDDFDILKFAQSSQATLSQLNPNTRLAITKMYAVIGEKETKTAEFNRFLPIEEAIETFYKEARKPKDQLEHDLEQEIIYKLVKENLLDLKSGKKRLNCYSTIESINGILVIEEASGYALPVNCFEINPPFEVATFNPQESRENSSKRLIKLKPQSPGPIYRDNNHNTGSVVDYTPSGVLKIATDELNDNTSSSVIIKQLNELDRKNDFYVHLYFGKDWMEGENLIYVNGTSQPTPINNSNRDTIKKALKELIGNQEQEESEPIGFAVFDIKNRTVHRKLDLDFTTNYKNFGPFY